MRINPDLLLELRQHMVAAMITLHGDFEKRIEELAAIKAAAEEKLGMIKSLDEAKARVEAMLAEAEQVSAKITGEARRELGIAEAQQRAAKEFLKRLEVKEAALAERERLVKDQEGKLGADTRAFQEQVSTQRHELNNREEIVRKQLEDVARREGAMATREAKLKAALV